LLSFRMRLIGSGMMVQAKDWAGHHMQACRKPMPVYV
jgi:hypothetical protein